MTLYKPLFVFAVKLAEYNVFVEQFVAMQNLTAAAVCVEVESRQQSQHRPPAVPTNFSPEHLCEKFSTSSGTFMQK